MNMRYTASAIVIGLLAPWLPAAPYKLADTTIVVPKGAPPMVKLAGDELRTYIHLLSHTWVPTRDAAPADTPAIVLRSGPGDRLPAGGADPAQNFALYADGGRQIVHGASPRATLWAAYELIESWGVGFYLGGDALPPSDADTTADLVERTCSPVLKIRGNLPWFNFLNSPTTWNPQDYKTFFAQMAKQKANLINFHAYDHEPFCGYGITDTNVTMGGPLMTTISPHRWWSPHIMATKDHLFGTDLFFDRGEWGCEVGIEDAWTFAPGRSTRLQQKMMADALTYAQSLGIETCLGFEVTGDPLDDANREGLRKRIKHVLDTYPLDYLGIWQSEGLGLTGHQVKGEQAAADEEELRNAFAYFTDAKHVSEGVRMARHIRFAYQVMKELRPHLKMVVSGWGGDQHMKFTDFYLGLDKTVPADIIFAALDNIDPRSADHVSEVYGKLSPGRVRWPIPWFESDGGHSRIDQTGPQTNVTAFEPLLKDIAAKGCEGTLGIHWRTRNVEDVAGYLYRFGWDKELTAAKFFTGYAADWFGPADADAMAKMYLRLEEFGPQYVGARGTAECASNGFRWFWEGKDPLVQQGPNLAGEMPDETRLPELDGMIEELKTRSEKAAAAGGHSAAMKYRDLAMTIQWLLTRARVGLAIWGESAPLEKRLREAESLFEQGKIMPARKQARELLADLQKLDFRSAMQALAGTCRTRGELGMLTTANARYGRYYAAFVQRIAYLLAEPLPEARGVGRWTSGPLRTVFLVPNQVGLGEVVNFDAVLLPMRGEQAYRIRLTRLDAAGDADPKPVELALKRLGGAYHRAVFKPQQAGTWAWKLVQMQPAGQDKDTQAGALPHGVVTVSRNVK